MMEIAIRSDLLQLRLMGRLDRTRQPIAFDWTGSGLEIHFRGSDLWAELEAPVASPVMWMIVLCDGYPVCRFPVEQGRRFYPLVLGMDPEKDRTVTLMKETQPMPAAPAATVLAHTLKLEGELLPLPKRDHVIEFVGDSLTSGEGSLAPRGNEEWITPWFSARANYSWVACNDLNAERRVLSQSGYGVCWDWQHLPENNMSDGYEQIVGVLSGPDAEARGCRKPYDFSLSPADIVCIRLLTNDNNGMNMKQSFEADRPIAIEGACSLIRKVRRCNPRAKIVWILPSTDCRPELAAEAVQICSKEGIGDLFTFTLPDCAPEELGARFHPNAGWNVKAGHLLADYLKNLL